MIYKTRNKWRLSRLLPAETLQHLNQKLRGLIVTTKKKESKERGGALVYIMLENENTISYDKELLSRNGLWSLFHIWSIQQWENLRNYPCQSNPSSPKSLIHPNLLLIAGTIEQHWSSSSATNLTGITSTNTNSTNIMSNSNQDL